VILLIFFGLDEKYEVRDGVVYTWVNDYLGGGNQRDTSGYNKASKLLSEHKGVIELLWDV
jgi:hypothetical protein